MSINTAFRDVKGLCALLGLALEARKEVSPCSAFLLLGAQVTISAQWVPDALSAQRENGIPVHLRNVLARGAMSADEAAKSRGKLGFPRPSCLADMGARRCISSPPANLQRACRPIPLSRQTFGLHSNGRLGRCARTDLANCHSRDIQP